MRKLAFLAYATIAYVLAMANFTYLVGFFADVGVPKGFASRTPALPVWQAMVVDAGLLLGFGLQHSLTARSAFKRRWTRIVPPPLERATYLYMTAGITAALVLLWQPIPITIEPDWAVGLILTGYLFVWGAMFVSTFQFGHLGFFGLTQVWRHVQGCRTPQPSLATRFLYGIVRHPGLDARPVDHAAPDARPRGLRCRGRRLRLRGNAIRGGRPRRRARARL